MKFPDFFLTFSGPSANFSDFLQHENMTFDLPMGHTDAKKISVGLILQKMYDLSFRYTKLNYGSIYKMSKY